MSAEDDATPPGRFSVLSLFPDSSQSTEKGGEGVEALLGGVGEEIVGDSDPGSYRPAAVSGTGCQVLPPSWVMSSLAPWRPGPAWMATPCVALVKPSSVTVPSEGP